MSLPSLHYIHDPLCGWCYAATPMVDAVNGAGFKITLHGGGLWDQVTRLGAGKRQHIRDNDQRIAVLAHREFGAAYLDGLLDDETTVFWSRPTIAALIAAATLGEHADLALLHAMQLAHYQEGLRIVESAVLENLAARIGLDQDAFSAALLAAPVDQHIDATRRLMQQFALRGFPSFLVERHGKYLPVPHESCYGDPDAFVRAVHAASERLPA